MVRGLTLGNIIAQHAALDGQVVHRVDLALDRVTTADERGDSAPEPGDGALRDAVSEIVRMLAEAARTAPAGYPEVPISALLGLLPFREDVAEEWMRDRGLVTVGANGEDVVDWHALPGTRAGRAAWEVNRGEQYLRDPRVAALAEAMGVDAGSLSRSETSRSTSRNGRGDGTVLRPGLLAVDSSSPAATRPAWSSSSRPSPRRPKLTSRSR